MNKFHEFHLARLENESWEAYEGRLLGVLRDARHSSAYKAILDLIELFVRKQFMLAMSCEPDELLEKQLSAKVGMRLYNGISSIDSLGIDPSEEQISDFSSRMPDMEVQSNSRYAASRRRKVAAAAGSPRRH